MAVVDQNARLYRYACAPQVAYVVPSAAGGEHEGANEPQVGRWRGRWQARITAAAPPSRSVIPQWSTAASACAPLMGRVHVTQSLHPVRGSRPQSWGGGMHLGDTSTASRSALPSTHHLRASVGPCSCPPRTCCGGCVPSSWHAPRRGWAAAGPAAYVLGADARDAWLHPVP